MTSAEQTGIVRWGLVGAARIAARGFLPAMREAGRGQAAVVGSRDADRGAAYAAEHGIDRSVVGYEDVVTAPDVDAVYVALANADHAEWTIRALEAGKAVLCEKPLCATAEQAERVLAVAAGPGRLLWEAFVFPFRAQHRRVVELIASGAIGEPREVVSSFHADIDRPGDFRMSPEAGGGALADVGCYAVRLGEEILGPATGDPLVAVGRMAGGIDVDVAGIVGMQGGRLYVTCGFRRGLDLFARILGQSGQLHLTGPFHPRRSDTVTLLRPGQDPVVEHPNGDELGFTAAVEHIHAVLIGEAVPLHLAVDSALSTARTLDALRAAVAANPLPEAGPVRSV